MRILVTGGAGYIGSITTRLLCDAGHECVVLDTLSRGHATAVDSRATITVGSVGDRVALDKLLPGCDAVMHLAGLIEVAESQEHPSRYLQVNVSEPAVMLEAMRDHGVEAIVFSSTAAVYGEPETVPITEDAALSPLNAYGLSKLTFERLLEWANATWGLRSIRLRYFNVAGAWPDGSIGEAHDPETHIIPRILLAMRDGRAEFEVYGDDYPTPDGTCVRDYLHVCDLADAHVAALESLVQGANGGVYNLGNGQGFSNLEVVNACAEATGRELTVRIGPRRPGDPARLVASAQAAQAALKWIPRRGDLPTIVADAWRWHESHPNGYGEASS
ncbi:MAG: UDP-glucose 4-epimerase GalE [Coriobacteriia bacterium]|nr:UDP-glucose 4-epimerase GalE [Coriobacteriia bacterium]